VPGNARPRRFSLARARALVARLDVDVTGAQVCLACLTFVSWPLHEGNEREAVSWARRLTPDLWVEGLEEYALLLVRGACERGVADAEAALDELELEGGRSAVARALVLQLAADLARRTRTELALEDAARGRLPLAPPGLN
jgi:hypothetical protein